MLDFNKVLSDSKKKYEDIKFSDFQSVIEFAADGSTEASAKGHEGLAEYNEYAIGNNLDYMKYLLKEKNMAESFKLIYIDPPFFSKANYSASFNLSSGLVKPVAYSDSLGGSREEYLTILGAQLMLMKDLLSEEGSIFVHLDWHASHYVKILMDEIFGEENFVNEIIWQYKSGGAGGKSFARKHDNILFYGKGPKRFFEAQKEKSYNRGLKPYKFKGVTEYQDEIGWYTMVNAKDVWNIDMVGRTSSERTGYATQKPEALLERVLLATTREGDLVGDFFSGSGVLAAVASRLNRNFACCDESGIAFGSLMGRLDCKGLNLRVLAQKQGNKPFILGGSEINIEFTAKDDTAFVDNIEYMNYILDERCFDSKSFAPMKKTLEEAPWELVSCISVDLDSKGDGFAADHYFAFGPGGMDKNLSFKLDGSREIRVVIVDVFGNFFDKSLKVG